MFPRVVAVRHLVDFELEIRFSDGVVARLDFRERVSGRGGVFQPFASTVFFALVSVDQEAGTLVWPNGVDFCPDVLYAEATGRDIAELNSAVEVA